MPFLDLPSAANAFRSGSAPASSESTLALSVEMNFLMDERVAIVTKPSSCSKIESKSKISMSSNFSILELDNVGVGF